MPRLIGLSEIDLVDLECIVDRCVRGEVEAQLWLVEHAPVLIATLVQQVRACRDVVITRRVDRLLDDAGTRVPVRLP